MVCSKVNHALADGASFVEFGKIWHAFCRDVRDKEAQGQDLSVIKHSLNRDTIRNIPVKKIAVEGINESYFVVVNVHIRDASIKCQ